jgi:hypothetical protein
MSEFQDQISTNEAASGEEGTTEIDQVRPPEYLFTYRITGKQSIERLQPLIENFRNEWLKPVSFCEFNPSGDYDTASNSTVKLPSALEFVWETTCEKNWKSAHSNAAIINRLNHTTIIESKSNLAYLQLFMNCPTLLTYVARTRGELLEWIQRFYSNSSPSDNNWWVIKASNGNGGKDIWVMNQENFPQIITEIPKMDEEYVVQK